MDGLIEELRDIRGVKSVERRSGPVLRINLYSREVGGAELFEIKGDLRKISQRIRTVMESGREKGVFSGWEWVIKPEKKYMETSLGRNKISDRKPKGHKPDYYEASLEE